MASATPSPKSDPEPEVQRGRDLAEVEILAGITDDKLRQIVQLWTSPRGGALAVDFGYAQRLYEHAKERGLA